MQCVCLEPDSLSTVSSVEVRGHLARITSPLTLCVFRKQIQVFRLGRNCLYLLSHPASPRSYFRENLIKILGRNNAGLDSVAHGEQVAEGTPLICSAMQRRKAAIVQNLGMEQSSGLEVNSSHNGGALAASTEEQQRC